MRLKDLPYGVQLRLHREGDTCRVNVYSSARKGLTVVGSGGSGHLIDAAVEALSEPLPKGTWIGSDEAGKGDLFGGISVCALCCPADGAGALRRLGARDSKGMSREAVRRVAGDVVDSGLFPFRLEIITPEEYNSRMESWRDRGGNSHDLLASLHGRAITSLLKEDCAAEELIVDRFCSASRLRPFLPAEAPTLNMKVRGESNPAVAAASIIARQAYMDSLAELSRQYAVDLSPGSGASADRALQRLVDIHGPPVLRKTAKLHFRNARRLLEPGSQPLS